LADVLISSLQKRQREYTKLEDKQKERMVLTLVLNDAVRQVLTSGHLAHLVTLNADGSPQVTLVWVGLDGDEIVCAHLGS